MSVYVRVLFLASVRFTLQTFRVLFIPPSLVPSYTASSLWEWEYENIFLLLLY